MAINHNKNQYLPQVSVQTISAFKESLKECEKEIETKEEKKTEIL